jgi:hypothetical protein
MGDTYNSAAEAETDRAQLRALLAVNVTVRGMQCGTVSWYCRCCSRRPSLSPVRVPRKRECLEPLQRRRRDFLPLALAAARGVRQGAIVHRVLMIAREERTQ